MRNLANAVTSFSGMVNFVRVIQLNLIKFSDESAIVPFSGQWLGHFQGLSSSGVRRATSNLRSR